MAAAVLIIGAGNRMRRDDGVGLIVLREIGQQIETAGISLASVEGECYSLLELWQDAASVFVIDAARGPAPGSVHRFDAIEHSLPPELMGASSHGFGVLHAVELARVLDRLPGRLVVYGIAGIDFGSGEGLSPQVAASVPVAVARIRQELLEATAQHEGG